MSDTKFFSKAFILVCLFCMSTALANESSLTVPVKVTDVVTLHLSKNIVDNDGDDYANLLQVFVVGKDEKCCADKTPIVGHYEVFNRGLKFVPRFDFIAGQDYVVRYRNEGAPYKYTEFTIQAELSSVTPKVLNIYPSGDDIPENTLRFYIHFSTPMKPHVAFDHIKLVDADGQIDDAAFMKFKQELWSEDRKRLTILFDPGRIKRGVATNLELGPALEEGKRYRLKIDGNWPSVFGRPLIQSYEKPIRVIAPVRQRIDPEQWQLSVLRINTMDALTITFDRKMDHALVERMISLRSSSGRLITGNLQLLKNETVWKFIPDHLWDEDSIYLNVQSELEDVSGNNIRDSLDHKISEKTLSQKTYTKKIGLQ